MTDEQKPRAYTYRLVTMNGLVVDFQAPHVLENMWTILKGDGFFSMANAQGDVMRRIPFHAIADLQYADQQSMALAYAQAPSGARN